jgi:DNA-binding protein HU-beta
MNQAEWIDAGPTRPGGATAQAAAERATDAVVAAAQRGRRREQEVALVGLGTFAAAVRPARRGFNPPTKPPMAIRAITPVRFKPGAELRAMA